MGRPFETSSTSLLHGAADDSLTAHLREAHQNHPACASLTQQRFERMLGVVTRRLSSVTVVLENLADTHNCSAVVRSAEGLGIDTVHVVEQPRKFKKHPQILAGADRWVELERHSSIEACLQVLRDTGFTTWAADIGPGCVPLDEIDISRPVAIIMGTERDGLTDRAKHLADRRFTIPMFGFTGSFNVSVSAAVALSAISGRRRREIPQGRSDLSPERASARLRRWLDREFERRGASRRLSANELVA